MLHRQKNTLNCDCSYAGHTPDSPLWSRSDFNFNFKDQYFRYLSTRESTFQKFLNLQFVRVISALTFLWTLRQSRSKTLISAWSGDQEYAFMHMHPPIMCYCYKISSSTISLHFFLGIFFDDWNHFDLTEASQEYALHMNSHISMCFLSMKHFFQDWTNGLIIILPLLWNSKVRE